MKLVGTPFKNSDTCEGVAFTDSSAGVDMSVIDITGRYPESGWAVNREVYEMVYIKRGLGSLIIRDAEEISLSEGDVVSVAPGQKFAWNGDMTIVMACSPPFNLQQYGVEK